MRLNAYTLAGDPAYIAASVASYYDAVDRIVVAFDRDGLGWTGDPMPVDEALAELRFVDPDGKLDLQPLAFREPGRSPLDCETMVRSQALTLASEGADWVVQLDSDEVIPDLNTFVGMIRAADFASAHALDFPSRWIYARLGDRRVLECCTQWWRSAAGYPGALAVRATTKLRLARQCEGAHFRVDFRSRNTDPWHPPNARVHETVPVEAGVLHFSWARTYEELLAKAATSAHQDDFDWTFEIARWSYFQRHPFVATALTPFRRRRHPGWLRTATLPIDPPKRSRRA